METEELQQIWKAVLEELTKTVKKSDFLAWFRNTALLNKEEGNYLVGIPSTIAYNNVRSLFMNEIKKAISSCDEGFKTLELKVDSSLHEVDERVVNVARLVRDLEKKPHSREVKLEEGTLAYETLNPHYTFAAFVVGPENQLAHAAALAVARGTGQTYNPLFVYGGVGLGKTHLLQAVGNEVKTRDRKKKVVYTTCEQLVQEIVNAIRSRRMEKFKERYREIDVLIVDDIQFLANKEQMQENFFHTFNTLYQEGKQIVLSSDRPPKELDTLEPRLRSRFEWGMIVDVQLPDLETRMAILTTKAQEKGLFLSREVIEFIARNAKSSVRELEGILNQALALYELRKVTPTVKIMAEILKKLNRREKLEGYTVKGCASSSATMEEVIRLVAGHFRVEETGLRSETRTQELNFPRQIAMYLCKNVLNQTYERIGTEFGGREHTSVMYACKKLEKDLQTNAQLRRDVNALKLEMGS